MRRLLLAPLSLLVVAACSASGAGDTTTEPIPTTTAGTTAVTAPPVECPRAPYLLTSLPAGVGVNAIDIDEIEPGVFELDVWTSVGGTDTTFYGHNDGTVAIALIRGTLPAVDWPGEKGEIEIDGTPGVVGPHPDGTWVAGWYEAPGERCDLYTMVYYPPWNPSDVESVLEGMNRVGG